MVYTKNTKSFDLCFDINWTNMQLGGFQTMFFCGKYQLNAHKAWMLGAVREQIWFQIWTPQMGKSPAWAIFFQSGQPVAYCDFCLEKQASDFQQQHQWQHILQTQFQSAIAGTRIIKKSNISISNQYARDELHIAWVTGWIGLAGWYGTADGRCRRVFHQLFIARVIEQQIYRRLKMPVFIIEWWVDAGRDWQWKSVLGLVSVK